MAVEGLAVPHGRGARLRDFNPDVVQDAAAVHHGDPVAEVHRFGEVVRHEQDRGPAQRAHLQQIVLQLASGDRVEGRKRLVQQQQRRLEDQRPGQRDPALLAAR